MANDFETTPVDLKKAQVKITGELQGDFVEFEFTLGDPDLTVELVLQRQEFNLFCEKHKAKIITAIEKE